jgi:hypothetical protein
MTAAKARPTPEEMAEQILEDADFDGDEDERIDNLHALAHGIELERARMAAELRARAALPMPPGPGDAVSTALLIVASSLEAAR